MQIRLWRTPEDNHKAIDLLWKDLGDKIMFAPYLLGNGVTILRRSQLCRLFGNLPKRAKTYKSTVDFEKQEISRSSEIALDKIGRQVQNNIVKENEREVLLYGTFA